MHVDITRKGNKGLITFHGQHPETKTESIVELFADAGIKVHASSITKAWIPGEPTATFRVTLEEWQYEDLIRQAFMPERQPGRQ